MAEPIISAPFRRPTSIHGHWERFFQDLLCGEHITYKAQPLSVQTQTDRLVTLIRKGLTFKVSPQLYPL